MFFSTEQKFTDITSIAQLDEEIANLSALLLNVKRHRNSLLTVNSFPPEILDTIFINLASAASWSYSKFLPQISHVCSYWRSASLNNPSLWNHIRIQGPQLSPLQHELLSRSKESSLHISFWSMDNKSAALVDLLNQIAPNAEKLATLRIDTTSFQMGHIMNSYRLSSAPNLEALYLSCFSGRWAGTQSDDQPSDHLQIPIFSDSIPNLKTLHLRSCVPSLDKIWITGLEELSIAQLPHGYHLVLSALPRMRSLRRLRLLDSFKPPGSDSGKHWNPSKATQLEFSFPVLEQLVLEGNLSSIAYFLKVASIPPNTSLSLMCTHARNLEHYQDLFCILQKCRTANVVDPASGTSHSSFVPLPVRTLFVRHLARDTYAIQAFYRFDEGRRAKRYTWVKSPSQQDSDFSGYPEFEISFHFPEIPIAYSTASKFYYPTLNHLETVYFNTEAGFFEPVLRQFLLPPPSSPHLAGVGEGSADQLSELDILESVSTPNTSGRVHAVEEEDSAGRRARFSFMKSSASFLGKKSKSLFKNRQPKEPAPIGTFHTSSNKETPSPQLHHGDELLSVASISQINDVEALCSVLHQRTRMYGTKLQTLDVSRFYGLTEADMELMEQHADVVEKPTKHGHPADELSIEIPWYIGV
ncbi:hypothetical protein AX16_001286 [Volvariella volvacea WC 439]|nr:hypothetical protein AX16_001286 [Volvariella volvacea WC 439]